MLYKTIIHVADFDLMLHANDNIVYETKFLKSNDIEC